MIIVQKTDFVGQYQLPRTVALDPVLDSYILREEKKTLYRLLGKELADLLIAYVQTPVITSGSLTVGTKYKITDYNTGDDFTNVGASSNATGVIFTATGTTPTVFTNASSLTVYVERYDNLLTPFYLKEDTCDYDNFYQSHGLKDLLLLQIYYSYITEEQIVTSQSGVSNLSAETGSVQSTQNAFRKVEQKWNAAGVDTWDAVRWYCMVKYPDVYPEYDGIQSESRYGSII